VLKCYVVYVVKWLSEVVSVPVRLCKQTFGYCARLDLVGSTLVMFVVSK